MNLMVAEVAVVIGVSTVTGLPVTAVIEFVSAIVSAADVLLVVVRLSLPDLVRMMVKAIT